ncbi:MAG: hypothetical protein M3373_07350 [Gemmatimonadota bacterium]|nr:hypothetical protein [Gemmatimonadota bacterium]
MPEGPPGRKTPEDFVEELKSLVAMNVAGNVRLAARVNDLLRDATKALSAQSPGKTADPSVVLGRWLDFNLAAYSAVSTHSLALLEGVVTAAERTLARKPPHAPDDTSEAFGRAEMRLEGRTGDRVRGPFLVENQYDRAVDVRFEADDLVPASGALVAAAHIAFEPPALIVPPSGQAVAHVAVTITPEFTVGQTYTTTVRVLGFQAREVGLSLTILPPTAGKRSDSTAASNPTSKGSRGARLAKKRTRTKPE